MSLAVPGPYCLLLLEITLWRLRGDQVLAGPW